MLSKSKYVAGKQCIKRLWLLKKRPDLIPEVSASTQARFDSGNRIGRLVQQRFPNGVEVPFPKDRDFQEMCATTQRHMSERVETLFEAAFIEDEVLVLCDVLQRKDNCWDAYEVKSSTSVKSYHYDDAAIQYYVLQKAGLPIDHMYILTLNPDYRLEGEQLNLEQLFLPHDVTAQVLAMQPDIPERLVEMKRALRGEEPHQMIGTHCSDPFACEFINYCWPKLPQPSVFNIPHIKGKAWTLYFEDKVALDHIEATDVNAKQYEYILDQLEQRERMELNAIDQWLSELQYPLYFLDFETIMPALPLLEGTRPYQPHLAVQYSLHVLNGAKDQMVHFEYLANFSTDFRADMANSLLMHLGSSGSIVAYNQGFEKACIRRLQEWCPDQAEALQSLFERFVDLMIPFQKGWYYKYTMGSSYSIKSVYPAMFPNATVQYSGLRISNGEQAMQVLLQLAEEAVDTANMEDIALRKDLLAYCEMDTLAMVQIYKELRRLCGKD